jgi:hypothetical protein
MISSVTIVARLREITEQTCTEGRKDHKGLALDRWMESDRGKDRARRRPPFYRDELPKEWKPGGYASAPNSYPIG